MLVLAGLLGISQPASAADGNFVNLSNRGLVGEGDDVRIVGFIIEGGARQVLIQALGPELANRGIANALADPVLTVTQTSEGEPPRTPLASPVELMVNDNWEDNQGQLVSDLWGGSPPLTAGSLSSAVVLTLEPGGYTAKVEGKNGTVGVAIVEVYRIASAGGGQETTHGVGDTLSDLPTGSWIPDLTSGGSFSSSGGNVTIRLNNGGYIEEGNFRYTCQSSGGCAIENRGVTSGTIIQTAQGTAPGGGTDTQPSFASGSGPGNQSYTVGTAISALTLPEASGGDGSLTYSLTPSIPGLNFNATTRRLTGAPTTAGTHSMTYTVTDADGDTDSLTFTITVSAETGHAPVDQAAFDRRFVGSSFRTASYFVDFDSAGRFWESYQFHGSYTYANTGSATGELTMTYDDGQYGGTCTFRLTFETATTGTSSFTCASGLEGDNDWHLAGIGAPIVRAVSDDDTVIELHFIDTFEAGETRAYDIQARTRTPRGPWDGGCTTITSDDAGTRLVSIQLRNRQPATVYEVRYRYRNSSSCSTGTPDEWSPIDWGTTAGGGTDTQPSFTAGSGPGNQSFTVGTAISVLTLPEASGGDGVLTYSLTPSVPGLNFNATTRRLSGTPTTADTHSMTYTVTDADGDTDSLTFTITVSAETGHAPVDQAAFDRRFVGSSFRTASYFIDFDSAGRFWESYQFRGSYTYANTGSATGELTMTYDGGQYGGTCTVRLTFETATTGTSSFTCASGVEGDNDWHLAGIGAPVVRAVSDDDTVIELRFIDTFEAGETRAYDIQARTRTPRGPWDGGCTTITSDDAGTRLVWIQLRNRQPATVYEVRYRYRNSSSCSTGTPDEWSPIDWGTTAGGGTDTQPSFASGSGPGDQSYTVGTAISVLTLPEASGGDGALTYSLTPSVPGLSFNATTRRLTGTPTTAGAHSMTPTP